MKEVFLVSEENRNKAEQMLKADDIVSRQSIAIKSANGLGIEKDGYFIILDGNEDAIKKAESLLKDVAEKYDNKDEIIKKHEEQENDAISGLGNILGG